MSRDGGEAAAISHDLGTEVLNLLPCFLSFFLPKKKSNCSQFHKYCTNAVTEISTGTSHYSLCIGGFFFCCLVKGK